MCLLKGDFLRPYKVFMLEFQRGVFGDLRGFYEIIDNTEALPLEHGNAICHHRRWPSASPARKQEAWVPAQHTQPSLTCCRIG